MDGKENRLKAVYFEAFHFQLKVPPSKMSIFTQFQSHLSHSSRSQTRKQIPTSFYSTSFVPQIIRFDMSLFQVATSCSPRHRRFTVSSLLPSDYKELNVQAQEATRKAIAGGIQLIEIQFPAVKEMATAALNQIMDANRSLRKRVCMVIRAQVSD